MVWLIVVINRRWYLVWCQQVLIKPNDELKAIQIHLSQIAPAVCFITPFPVHKHDLETE